MFIKGSGRDKLQGRELRGERDNEGGAEIKVLLTNKSRCKIKREI